ncbi:hypothetical protein [Sphaerimonospora mesophila]|uniref:hypothetical protein n=1 Tax=Sphaerimonospora mesophila TaxID=37483 RepID=UPI0006E3AB70
MVRHSAGTPLAGVRAGARRLTLATVAIAAAGALAAPQVAAHAAVARPAVPGIAPAGAGGGGNGGGTGTGTGSAVNSSGGTPIQQAAITVNGLSTFQAAVCNQRMQMCNINQQLWTQW